MNVFFLEFLFFTFLKTLPHRVFIVFGFVRLFLLLLSFFFLPTFHHEFVIDWSEIFTEASFGDPNKMPNQIKCKCLGQHDSSLQHLENYPETTIFAYAKLPATFFGNVTVPLAPNVTQNTLAKKI